MKPSGSRLADFALLIAEQFRSGSLFRFFPGHHHGVHGRSALLRVLRLWRVVQAASGRVEVVGGPYRQQVDGIRVAVHLVQANRRLDFNWAVTISQAFQRARKILQRNF